MVLGEKLRHPREEGKVHCALYLFLVGVGV